MQHILGIYRYQMRISSLENAISTDNQVRFMDAFVESLELFITLMVFMNIKKNKKSRDFAEQRMKLHNLGLE